MPAIWISRNAEGVVEAAHVAAYTEPSELQAWKADGRTPELIVAATVTLGVPLPPETPIVQTL